MRHLNAVGATILVAGALAALPSGATAQSACGGLLQPKCPPPTATTPAPAPTLPLSPARYQALQPIVVAEAGDGSASTDARLTAACDALDVSDPLLSAERRLCLALVRVDRVSRDRAIAHCTGDRACRRAFGRFGHAALAVATVAEQTNTVVGSEISDAGCRAVVLTPTADIRFVRRFGHAAVRVAGAKTRRRTVAALKAVAKVASDGGSDDDALAKDDPQRFRDACSVPD